MICPNCKKIYNDRLSYCISCGTELVPEENGETPPSSEQDITENSIFPDNAPSPADEAGFVRRINITVPEPRAQSFEAVPIRKVHSGGRKIGKKLLAGSVSAVLSLFIASSFALMFGSLAGRELTSRKNIESGIKQMDILSVPVSEFGIVSTEGYAVPPDATIEKAVSVMTAGSGVTSGNIRSIYENSTFKVFLCAAAAEYAEYIRTGTQPEKITADKVKDVLNENISVISSNTGCKLSDSDIALAYSEIDRSEQFFDSLSVSSLESRAGESIRLARAYISFPALAAEAAAAAVCAVLIFILNKDLKKTLRYTGVPLIVTGLASLVFTFMFSMQIGFFSELSGLERELAKGAAAAASDGMYRTGWLFFFVGAAAMLVSAIKMEKAQ